MLIIIKKRRTRSPYEPDIVDVLDTEDGVVESVPFHIAVAVGISNVDLKGMLITEIPNFVCKPREFIYWNDKKDSKTIIHYRGSSVTILYPVDLLNIKFKNTGVLVRLEIDFAMVIVLKFGNNNTVVVDTDGREYLRTLDMSIFSISSRPFKYALRECL